MSDRPIIFSGEMVRAILEGRKTQTRRVIKPQPSAHYWQRVPGYQLRMSGPLVDANDGRTFVQFHHTIPQNKAWDSEPTASCPYGQPGDRLWVRETFCVVDDRDYGEERWVDYRATPKYAESHPAGWDNAPDDAEALKWRPSIHMPRWASRITLEVVRVDVERVQEICEQDVLAEGTPGAWTTGDRYLGYRANPNLNSYQFFFQKLWDSINAKRGFGWDSNPWVWVVEFKVVQP